MFQMLGVFAEFERALTQERVRAGLARARSEGKRLGRPPNSRGDKTGGGPVHDPWRKWSVHRSSRG